MSDMMKSHINPYGTDTLPGGEGARFQKMNSRKIEPLPNRKTTKFFHIYNISDHRTNPRVPISWTRSLGSIGTYYIWSRNDGELYSKPVLVPDIFYEQYDAGIPGGWGGGNVVGEIRYREWDGERIVREILGTQPPTNPLGLDLTMWGVFVAKGDEPTQEELDECRAKMAQTYQMAVQEADMMWEDPNDKKNITAMHRRAAKYLLQERPWCSVPKAMIACPGCGVPVSPEVAFHAVCGTIVNFEMAKKQREREAELDAVINKGKKTAKKETE